MLAIFDALPGIEVPVGSISKSLAKMWSDTADQGGAAPSAEEGKATQINLVLHLGFGTVPDDGVAQFQTAVSFSRRYPCRVVVLCPLQEEMGETAIRAKIYGECHLGKSKGDKRCCEFVMLSYPPSARPFLENQVSVCLSTDLPLYYWAHRFKSSGRLADYRYLLIRSFRVMFDSAIVPADAVDFPWPRRESVRDLVFARLLPVRQTIGQFLSGTAPEKLVEGLTGASVSYSDGYAAEARVLLNWIRSTLRKCGADEDLGGAPVQAQGAGIPSLELKFEYNNGRSFVWKGDFPKGHALFTADFGNGPTTLPTNISLLSPEASLGEAMFF